MGKTTEETLTTIIPNIGAPDVFADSIVGAFLTNGNVHMTLSARRCDYSVKPNEFSNVVIGRLVMPLSAAEDMAKFVAEFVARMKQQPAHLAGDAPKTLQ